MEEFQKNGGDLQSLEAAPLGVELILAFADLAKEFDLDLLKPVGSEETKAEGKTRPTEANESAVPESLKSLWKLFTFEKKRDVEKYCRDLTIRASDFTNFIMACEVGQGPFLHRIHHRDHVPEHLHPTDDDLAALSANGVGPLTPDAQKCVRKLGQIFKDRCYLVGHIFYTPDLSQWHFFQFDQRDTQDGKNHWKQGAHIHFLNWLWPNHDAQTVWTSFTSGKVKLNDSLHVRYSED